jgi:hypothetical protein
MPTTNTINVRRISTLGTSNIKNRTASVRCEFVFSFNTEYIKKFTIGSKKTNKTIKIGIIMSGKYTL